jgi:FtsP/CotA-like multicopper oxidase with cupredoxin domain
MPDRDRARVSARVPVRAWVGIALTLVIVGPLAWMWWGSRLPSTYTVMDMGVPEYGGGPSMSHDMHMSGMSMPGDVSVARLDTPKDRKADVVVDLTARQGTVKLASGKKIEGYTVNGTSPGPTLQATVGQLVEVRVHNADVSGGIAIHWHGVDVPNAEDGVAGVTQDAIKPGQDHTYRWVAPHVGTYWYHSHQISHEQVAGGLLGAIVIRPKVPEKDLQDVMALLHLYGDDDTVNGRTGDQAVEAPAGQRVRVRVINTDNGPQPVWTSVPYELVASDGYDVNQPTPVRGRTVMVPAGGRVDLEMTVPSDGTAAGVQLGDGHLVIGPSGSKAPALDQPEKNLDLLGYGDPAPLPFDPAKGDRHFTYSIGRRPGFVNGKPGLWWSVNGKLWPHLPMMMVRKGDVVRVTISNHSGDVHPMHLHGHHAVVVSRDGKPVTGSPWWFDSLDVQDGQSFEIAFVADNPGIWMDHCHNLKHAAQGLVTHLMYEGVTTPYELGSDSGNEPE